MKKHAFYWLALGLLFMAGCQKELSFELGTTPAKGSLQSDITGDCLPKTVNGTYVAGIPLVPTANTITVSVNVTRTGIYTITTDTVNGYFFRGTGTFTTLGPKSVTLRGNGTPFIDGVDNFIVSFDGTICDIAVTVAAPGVGTLAGAPSACAPITVSGGYSPGVALTANNFAVVQVNVTTAGSFVITTDTVAGVWFTFSGTLPLGAQSVTLQAQGSIPAATVSGAKTFTVKLGASQCTFVVNIASPAVGTVNCTGAVFAGTFTAGVAMTATNTAQISVTVTTPGAYTITTDTMNGVWFNASGIFPTATTTPLTLTGNGTPGVSGPFTFTVKFGASTCTFSITFAAGGSAFIADCSTAFPDADGLYEVGTQLIPCANTVDIDIDVTALGPYNIATAITNGMIFSASGTFTMLGVQTITLVGSGTPLTATTSNIPMPGTTPCTFPIVVDAALPIDWQFTKTNAPAAIYRGQTDFATLIPNGPSIVFVLDGSNSLGADAFSVVLSDLNGTIANGETYSTSALPTGNFAIFSYDLPLACAETYSANFSVAGVSIIFTVTSHDIATQTITGTFTGTAKNVALQTVNIGTGTFTGTY